MTVVNRVYITDELLQSLGNMNIPNIDLAHNPMFNQYSYEYNRMYGSFHNNQNIVNITNLSNDVTYMGEYSGSWGTGVFSNCANLVDAPDLANCTNLTYTTYLFSNCYNLVNAPRLPNSVTQMQAAYSNCRSLVNAPELPNSITDLTETFATCTNLVNAPVIPNSVTYMHRVFAFCASLVNAPTIPNSVTETSELFYQCPNLTNVPSLANCTNLTNMYTTFRSCWNLVNAPELPNSVVKMEQTFGQCSSLVNVSDLSNCTNLAYMNGTFSGCTSLVDAPAIPNSIIKMSDTFADCQSLVNAPDLSNCTNLTNMQRTFYDCQNLVNVSSIPNSVQDMYATFQSCWNLTGDIIIESEKVADASYCFGGTNNQKNVLIPFNMSSSIDFTKYYYWITKSNKIVYCKDDFYSKSYGSYQWIYSGYILLDENFNYLNGEIGWNPNEQKYMITYEDTSLGYWVNEEIYYNSSNNIVIHKNAGDTSLTYDSFIEAGYSTTNRVDGVLLKDINDKGSLSFANINPKRNQGTNVYVDGVLINQNAIELPSGVHEYELVNPNYPTYYGSATVIKDDKVWVNVDLTQITGHNITINTSEPNCTVTINGETATAVTSTQYVSKSLYSESSREIDYSVEKSGYYTESGSVVFNNANVSLNITLESSDIDLTNWSYTTDEWGNVTLEDYIGPDVETLVIPNTRN